MGRWRRYIGWQGEVGEAFDAMFNVDVNGNVNSKVDRISGLVMSYDNRAQVRLNERQKRTALKTARQK